MKTLSLILIILTLSISEKLFAQEENEKISSKIESVFVEGILKLKASATNQSTNYKELNYLFVSIKKGGAGNISNNKRITKMLYDAVVFFIYHI